VESLSGFDWTGCPDCVENAVGKNFSKKHDTVDAWILLAKRLNDFRFHTTYGMEHLQ
jgi:hypothetical protein